MPEPRAAARPEDVPGGPFDHKGSSRSQRPTRCPADSLDREWQDEYSPGMDGGYRLITIPPSHFCEKARWALDRGGTPYREERHPPVLHARASRAAGGGRTVPVLVTDLGSFADSTDIIRFLDMRRPESAQLYPGAPELRDQVDELEALCNDRLGPHVRRLAYFHLLPHRRLLLDTVLDGVPRRDRLVFTVALPLMRSLLRRGLRISPESATRSLAVVREVFAAIGERVADGRDFLVGDRFTAADLSFGALAAPVLLPRGFGSHLPSLADLPSPFLTLVDDLRQTAAGSFALRLYRDLR